MSSRVLFKGINGGTPSTSSFHMMVKTWAFLPEARRARSAIPKNWPSCWTTLEYSCISFCTPGCGNATLLKFCPPCSAPSTCCVSSSDRGRQTSHHYKMAFPTWTTTTCYVRILYTYHLEPVSWILLVMTSQKSCKNTRFCKADFSLQELLFKIALLCIFWLKSGLPLFWP